MLHDARDVGAFIPAELDDYPLTASEFRVYCRIVRRAGGQGCWESNVAMGEALGLGERTVREAKALLAAAGLVSVQRRSGRTDVYWLTPSSEWADGAEVEGLRRATRRPKSTPVPTTAVPATGHRGPHDRTTAVPTTDEGTTREGNTSKGAARRKRASRLPESWQPNEGHVGYADANGIDLDLEADKFRDHAEATDRKLVSWDAAFRNWLRNAKGWSKPSTKPATLEPGGSAVLDRNEARARGEACPDCAGVGYVEIPDTNDARPCDCTKAVIA